MTAKIGDTVSFEVTATNVATYQWQYSLDNGATWKNSGTADAKTKKITFKVGASSFTMLRRCEMADADGVKAYTDTVKTIEKVESAVVITTQPVNVTAKIGDTVSFEVIATNVATYQWQYSLDNGVTWKNSGTADAKTKKITFKVAEANFTMLRRCEMTDADGIQQWTDEVTVIKLERFTIEDVTYYILEDGISVMVEEYTGTSSSVTIPATVNGYSVVKIGESAFEGNTNLTSIDLPDSITVIGKRAFASCSNLSKME